MKLSLVSVLLILSFFGGCSGIRPQQTLREITSESEGDFPDLVFAIREHKKLPDGTQTILASGIHNGRPVGLEILLGPAWLEGSLGTDLPLSTYRGEVIYRSIGAESDLLIQSLDQLYGTKQSPKAMNKATTFTGITLGGDPRDLAKEPVKIKLFFESDAEDGYAELYTDIDLKAGKLYINEKDEEYRPAIIGALKSP